MAAHPATFPGMLKAKPLAAFAGSAALLLVIVLSSTVTVRASTVPLFSDGFESTTLDAWTTSRGIVVQNDIVASGAWAA